MQMDNPRSFGQGDGIRSVGDRSKIDMELQECFLYGWSKIPNCESKAHGLARRVPEEQPPGFVEILGNLLNPLLIFACSE